MRNKVKSAFGGKNFFAKLLLVAGFLILLSSIVPAKASGTPVADQVVMPDYYVQGGWKYYTDTTAYDICQLFYPTKTQFAYFDLALTNTNPDAGSTWADIRTNGTLHRPATVLNTYHQVSYVNFEDSRTMAHMNPQNGQEITLETNKGYWICITHLPQNAKIYYSDPTDYSGSLITGYSSATVFHSTQAFGFRTYGYNPTVDTPAVNTPTATTNSGSTGSAPSNTTSASISAPTSVTAAYAPANQGVSVTWTASKTADITGYNIYRTATSGKSYTKIGAVAKSALQYVDGTAAKSTTYYYMVRSYKDSSESVNSNEAKVDVPADAVITPIAKSKVKVLARPDWYGGTLEMNIWTWCGIGLVGILLLALIALIVIRDKKNKKTGKKEQPAKE
ncbi:MAG: hypothetical protein WCP91_03515 [Candidatus Berkelbacteria bacterium]